MNTHPKRMGKIKLFISGIFFALMATSCCLGALVFLIFGVSFGWLSIFEPLAKYRWILSGIAILCFVAYIFMRPKTCSKNCNKKRVVSAILGGALMIFILFYPEILGTIYA